MHVVSHKNKIIFLFYWEEVFSFGNFYASRCHRLIDMRFNSEFALCWLSDIG